MRIIVLACVALLGCPGSGKRPPKDKQPAKQATPEVKNAPEAKNTPEAKNAPDGKQAPPTNKQPVPENHAKLLPGAPLPITDILRKPPPTAQAKLGEPTAKGMTRRSCVRWVPKKTWFECDYVFQRYDDKTGTYGAIQVVYEDGAAATVAFEGVPGEGEFDPVKALAKVGLELPGKPKESTPAENVKLWSWFNDDARLVIDGMQHRVEVSVVEGDWKKSKVEIFLNHPLTKAQQEKIMKKGG